MNPMRAGKPDSRESGIVQRMRFQVRNVPIDNPRVLLACSGGKDSVALAAIMAELQRLGLLEFSIAHIHHGQHNQADAAAAAVLRIGEQLGVEVAVRHLDPACIDRHQGVGLEEALRRERYLQLAKVAEDIGAHCIALAHHQMDQAETMLLHLMRGSGLEGLAGMRIWEDRKVPWWAPDASAVTMAFWRPLLQEQVEEVAAFASHSGLPVVEDPTNVDTRFRRNAIRHQLLPLMEEIAAGSTGAIARTGDVLSTDLDALVQITQAALENCIFSDGLSQQRLVEMPIGLQRRVVRAWILAQYPVHELSADRVDAVLDAASRNRGGAMVQLGSGLTVRLHDRIFTIDS